MDPTYACGAPLAFRCLLPFWKLPSPAVLYSTYPLWASTPDAGAEPTPRSRLANGLRIEPDSQVHHVGLSSGKEKEIRSPPLCALVQEIPARNPGLGGRFANHRQQEARERLLLLLAPTALRAKTPGAMQPSTSQSALQSDGQGLLEEEEEGQDGEGEEDDEQEEPKDGDDQAGEEDDDGKREPEELSVETILRQFEEYLQHLFSTATGARFEGPDSIPIDRRRLYSLLTKALSMTAAEGVQKDFDIPYKEMAADPPLVELLVAVFTVLAPPKTAQCFETGTPKAEDIIASWSDANDCPQAGVYIQVIRHLIPDETGKLWSIYIGSTLREICIRMQEHMDAADEAQELPDSSVGRNEHYKRIVDNGGNANVENRVMLSVPCQSGCSLPPAIERLCLYWLVRIAGTAYLILFDGYMPSRPGSIGTFPFPPVTDQEWAPTHAAANDDRLRWLAEQLSAEEALRLMKAAEQRRKRAAEREAEKKTAELRLRQTVEHFLWQRSRYEVCKAVALASEELLDRAVGLRMTSAEFNAYLTISQLAPVTRVELVTALQVGEAIAGGVDSRDAAIAERRRQEQLYLTERETKLKKAAFEVATRAMACGMIN
ncbi:hypothetical protein BJ508DRAFT_304028 [Ascobolus immersus RN42]|uniref:Uncharacterized protein n=1 Tax=Ascobolus immersus RN42 TaxID=1160509 RepID=A0A3N4IF28_ASCIM|nr:hypothetical protein BJ508DRAFT_304028 [Ascobolus immersus RN42]